MATNVLPINAIVTDPAIKNGQPIVVGTALRVIDIVASHIYRGFGPEELSVQFNIPLGHVHAALAYYYLHKSELDDKMRRNADEAEALLAEIEAQGKLIRVE